MWYFKICLTILNTLLLNQTNSSSFRTDFDEPPSELPLVTINAASVSSNVANEVTAFKSLTVLNSSTSIAVAPVKAIEAAFASTLLPSPFSA